MSTGKGRLFDTYVAALQHDIAEVPSEATLVGVVRRPTPWFYAAVDENIPDLGPPPNLLDAVKTRHEALEESGLPDAEAHNRALEEVDYRERYLEHLEGPAEADFESLLSRLKAGEDIALVCYENTDEKRCHRTMLRAAIEDRLDSGTQD